MGWAGPGIRPWMPRPRTRSTRRASSRWRRPETSRPARPAASSSSSAPTEFSSRPTTPSSAGSPTGSTSSRRSASSETPTTPTALRPRRSTSTRWSSRRARSSRWSAAALVTLALAAGLGVAAVSPAESAKRLAYRSPRATPDGSYRCPLPDRYRGAFESAARDTHLPVALLVSVARVESNLDNRARSRAGARGLLQLMPPTAAELRLDPDRPSSNVLAGARYLKQLLEQLGSVDLALSAYNAGPGAVERAGGAPGGETLTYVANVNRLWQRIRGCT